MAITIHPDLEAKLRARAQAAGLTVETYIERIALDEEEAENDIERLALEGLESGEAIVADDRFWAEKRQRLIDRYGKPGAR